MKAQRPHLYDTELSDKYTITQGPIWINGTQAITRLLLEQARLDHTNGLNTAGYVSGYRGSPLGGVDLALMKESKLLKEHRIHFDPGVNEDLAATAVWGTQQANIYPTASYDGVFGLWYGKSPGLDRSGDVFRHANMAGTSKHGGVLALVGDDPACKSSTLPSASAGALKEFLIPVVAPADIEDIITLGLAGWALSRYSGCWVGMTAITAIMDSAATINIDKINRTFIFPETDFDPTIGLVETPHSQELRIGPKLKLAAQFGTVNGLNRIAVDCAQPRLAILGVGKAYTDLRQALRTLGFSDETALSAIGLRIIKIGYEWPLESDHVKSLLNNVPSLLVIEGKQPFFEDQLKSILYGKNAPTIEGRRNRHGHDLISSIGEITSGVIVRTLLSVFADHGIPIPRSDLKDKLMSGDKVHSGQTPANVSRQPLYCPGCPHSISTRVPDGSRGLAGIGCHYMVQWMDRNTHTFTHMGGEGANWVGQARFVDDPHVFVNMGDGTYFHSGLMAIRAAVASKVNVTFKLLFNDAVAMTGGQSVEGNLTVTDIVRQVVAENVTAVHVVTDNPRRYENQKFRVSHRDRLDEVQEELREIQGCTVLIFDQACANELRRRRKRGLEPKKMKRVVINDAVCEGCGDCTKVSMCSAIEPVSTDFGLKRRINQTACNQDLSCMKGYCPAMIEIEALPSKESTVPVEIGTLPDPTTALPTSANILIAGVGGTGVVTVSQILGVAALVEGKRAATLDMTGLAQKGGAVFANVRISDDDVLRVQIPEQETDVLLGSDLVTSVSQECVALLNKDRTNIVVNTHLIPTSKFVLHRQTDTRDSDLVAELSSFGTHLHTIDAAKLTTRMSGSSTTANMALLGCAWQLGLIPLKAESIERALEINNTMVQDNILSFRAGRRYALDPNFLDTSSLPPSTMFPVKERTLEELIQDRMEFLTQYQNTQYAKKLKDFAEIVQSKERELTGEVSSLSRVAVETYFKLLAYKDEYEVARLLTHPSFRAFVDSRFSNVSKMQFAFAPTWLPNAQKSKIRVGSWAKLFLKLLSLFKGLRGTPFDPFGYTPERKFELQLLKDFHKSVDVVCTNLRPDNLRYAEELFSCYGSVRGYGHVKLQSWDSVKDRVESLRTMIQNPEVSEKLVHSVENV